jgi:hypothetical protein
VHVIVKLIHCPMTSKSNGACGNVEVLGAVEDWNTWTYFSSHAPFEVVVLLMH